MLKIKRLDTTLPLPKYESEGAAGIDLYASEGGWITKFGTIIPTGIAIALEPGYEAQIRPRSGLARKHGITIVNSPGTIDSDYRGEICVLLQVPTEVEYHVERGDRIAQMVIKEAPQVQIQEVDYLDETVRSDGGFGSTG